MLFNYLLPWNGNMRNICCNNLPISNNKAILFELFNNIMSPSEKYLKYPLEYCIIIRFFKNY